MLVAPADVLQDDFLSRSRHNESMSGTADTGDKEMNLRYTGTCVRCGQTIPKNYRAIYNRVAKNVRHINCEAGIALGQAGGSAAREYERRLAREVGRRERDIAQSKERINDALGNGFLARIATFLAVDESPYRVPQSTKAWSSGAVGEQRVGARLDALAEVGVITLHDRRIPGSRANIDHLVVTPWDVWVVDAKRYVDKRVTFDVVGSFFGIGGRKRLLVDGRDRTKLVDGIENQVAHVEAVLPIGVNVNGCLCFVDSEWPLLAADFAVRGIEVCWPRRLAKTLLRNSPPSIDAEAVAKHLASVFRPA